MYLSSERIYSAKLRFQTSLKLIRLCSNSMLNDYASLKTLRSACRCFFCPTIDDITVCSACVQTAFFSRWPWLNSLKRCGWTLNEAKTIKAVPEINILECCVGNENIKPDLEQLHPLLNMPAPQDAKSLKQALGMLAYYIKWVMNFSDEIANLNFKST